MKRRHFFGGIKKYTEICKTADLCAVYRRKGHGNDTQKGN